MQKTWLTTRFAWALFACLGLMGCAPTASEVALDGIDISWALTPFSAPADGKSKIRIDVTVSASAGLTGRAGALMLRSDEPTDTLTQPTVIDEGGRAVAEISASRPGSHTLTALIDQAGAYTALKTQRQVTFTQAAATSNPNSALDGNVPIGSQDPNGPYGLALQFSQADAAADPCTPVAFFVVATSKAGLPSAGKRVTLSTARPDDRVEPTVGTTDAEGRMRAVLYSARLGSAQVLARTENVLAQGTVAVVAMAPSMQVSQWNLPSPAVTTVADGVAKHPLSITVRDGSGRAVPNVPVRFESDEPGDVIEATSSRSNQQGVAQAALSSTRAGPRRVLAAVGQGEVATTVTLFAGPADGSTSWLSASPNVRPADGTSAVSLVLNLVDAHRNPVAMQPAKLRTQGNAAGTVKKRGTTDALGLWQQSWRSRLAGINKVVVDVAGFSVMSQVRFEAVAPPCTGSLNLSGPPLPNVGRNPLGVLAVDLNADGHTDVVTANAADNTISVALGAGGRQFTSVAHHPVGDMPSAVAAADLNGDGQLDLVVTNSGSDTVSILLGQGLTAFGPATTQQVGAMPKALALIDVNGDGLVDILSASSSGNQASVSLGRGDGTFQTAVLYPVGQMPVAIVAADLNHDGLVDLVTADEQDNSVSVLLAQSQGLFGTAQPYLMGAGPSGLALGDLNRDGHVDVVTSNRNDGTVSVLLGDGTGSFGISQAYSAGDTPTSVALADIDHDGILDVISIGWGSYTSDVLLGYGDGALRPKVSSRIQANATALALAHFAGTPELDLVTTAAGDMVYITYGQSDGSFTEQLPSLEAPAGRQPQGIRAVDLNGDGLSDVLVANTQDNTISVLDGRPDGSFELRRAYPVGRRPMDVCTGDFNGDGRPDVATANLTDGSVTVLLSQSDGTLAAGQSYSAGAAAYGIASADLNLDGLEDLVIANRDAGTLSVLLAKPDGTMMPAANYPAGAVTEHLALADFNGDGLMDVAVTSRGDSTLRVRMGQADGTFGPQAIYGTGSGPVHLVAADFNGDGLMDLALGIYSETSVQMFRGDGQGNLVPHTAVAMAGSAFGLLAADLNGDGLLDLVSTHGETSVVVTAMGQADGSFAAPQTYSTPGRFYAYNSAVADTNGDGRLDIITANSGSSSIGVFRNVGCLPQ